MINPFPLGSGALTIIIRKKENTVAKKISNPEELLENSDDFERDYAYGVKLRSEKSVTFKILIGMKLPYWPTFQYGALFKKIHRTNNKGEYSLLSGSENMKVLHEKIKLFIDKLQNQLVFIETRVGGTKGTLNKLNHSQSISKYARDNFTPIIKFNQKP